MIEGVKLHVKSDELVRLLRERAKYHQDRAGQKEAEIPKLTESMKAIDQPPPGAAFVSNSARGYNIDPVEALREQVHAHRLKAQTFLFYADHVAPSETYVLAEADLSRLELVTGQ